MLVVQLARHEVLLEMTSAGGACFQLVAADGTDMSTLSHVDVAARAQLIMSGEL